MNSTYGESQTKWPNYSKTAEVFFSDVVADPEKLKGGFWLVEIINYNQQILVNLFNFNDYISAPCLLDANNAQ